MKRTGALLILSLFLPLAAAAGAAAAGPSGSGKPRGAVRVLYAGSLGAVMEQAAGPAFERATGYEYQGEGHGSVADARMMRDRLRAPDVFLSADPAVNRDLLMPPRSDLVAWYLTFASGELVLGYNPKSRFRALFEQVKAGKLPWYEALATPGLRFGRTDPELDPKGYRTVFLFELADRYYKRTDLVRLLGPPGNPAQTYPEAQLLIRLESGQLDAGIFYRHELTAHRVPFIELPDEINQGNPRLAALYQHASYTTERGATVFGSPILFTVAIPAAARNVPGAVAFVRFLLSRQGRAMLRRYGFGSASVLLAGDAAKVPAELRSLIQGRYAP
jgi:molybdate/tungstate transport system substrate-binding protein